MALSRHGISEPLTMPSGKAVIISLSTEITVYPLELFHSSDENFNFLPDQAGFHYAGHSLDFLHESLIHYVDKADNSVNLSEARPIEDF